MTTVKLLVGGSSVDGSRSCSYFYTGAGTTSSIRRDAARGSRVFGMAVWLLCCFSVQLSRLSVVNCGLLLLMPVLLSYPVGCVRSVPSDREMQLREKEMQLSRHSLSDRADALIQGWCSDIRDVGVAEVLEEYFASCKRPASEITVSPLCNREKKEIAIKFLEENHGDRIRRDLFLPKVAVKIVDEKDEQKACTRPNFSYWKGAFPTCTLLNTVYRKLVVLHLPELIGKQALSQDDDPGEDSVVSASSDFGFESPHSATNPAGGDTVEEERSSHSRDAKLPTIQLGRFPCSKIEDLFMQERRKTTIREIEKILSGDKLGESQSTIFDSGCGILEQVNPEQLGGEGKSLWVRDFAALAKANREKNKQEKNLESDSKFLTQSISSSPHTSLTSDDAKGEASCSWALWVAPLAIFIFEALQTGTVFTRSTRQDKILKVENLGNVCSVYFNPEDQEYIGWERTGEQISTEQMEFDTASEDAPSSITHINDPYITSLNKLQEYYYCHGEILAFANDVRRQNFVTQGFFEFSLQLPRDGIEPSLICIAREILSLNFENPGGVHAAMKYGISHLAATEIQSREGTKTLIIGKALKVYKWKTLKDWHRHRTEFINKLKAAVEKLLTERPLTDDFLRKWHDEINDEMWKQLEEPQVAAEQKWESECDDDLGMHSSREDSTGETFVQQPQHNLQMDMDLTRKEAQAVIDILLKYESGKVLLEEVIMEMVRHIGSEHLDTEMICKVLGEVQPVNTILGQECSRLLLDFLRSQSPGPDLQSLSPLRPGSSAEIRVAAFPTEKAQHYSDIINEHCNPRLELRNPEGLSRLWTRVKLCTGLEYLHDPLLVSELLPIVEREKHEEACESLITHSKAIIQAIKQEKYVEAALDFGSTCSQIMKAVDGNHNKLPILVSDEGNIFIATEKSSAAGTVLVLEELVYSVCARHTFAQKAAAIALQVAPCVAAGISTFAGVPPSLVSGGISSLCGFHQASPSHEKAKAEAQERLAKTLQVVTSGFTFIDPKPDSNRFESPQDADGSSMSARQAKRCARKLVDRDRDKRQLTFDRRCIDANFGSWREKDKKGSNCNKIVELAVDHRGSFSCDLPMAIGSRHGDSNSNFLLQFPHERELNHFPILPVIMLLEAKKLSLWKQLAGRPNYFRVVNK